MLKLYTVQIVYSVVALKQVDALFLGVFFISYLNAYFYVDIKNNYRIQCIRVSNKLGTNNYIMKSIIVDNFTFVYFRGRSESYLRWEITD